ncbi:MAG: hypothetical protein WDO74_07760 [Pseudomonadota bacterium]
MAFAGCSTDAVSPGAGGSPSAGGGRRPLLEPLGIRWAGSSAVGGSGATAGLGSPTAGSGGAPGSAGASTGGGGTTGGAGASGAPKLDWGHGQADGTHQTIQGFGLNDALLSATWSTQVLDNLFTTKGDSGIGLQVLRIGMSSDGNLAGTTQSNIDGAKSRGAKIIGSTWSPPASCKTNGKTIDGGHTKDTLLRVLVGYDRCLRQEKTDSMAMSIGNEPDFASCGTAEPCNGNYDTTLYTAKEMVAFIKVAGPKLQALTPPVKVISPEASEWLHTWSNESATGSIPGNKNSSDPMKCGFPASNAACTNGDGYDYGHWLAKDPDAWKALDILGVHEYDTQHAEPWPADVTVARKEVWQTEMSGVLWWPEQGTGSKGTDTIENGVAVAGWIHSALVVGEASAWLWWWYNAYNTDDNEGLLLGKTGTTLTRRYYALGNYSKFVRPGYVMVDVTGNSNADILLSAFKGTDGIVVVAINKGAAGRYRADRDFRRNGARLDDAPT